MTDQDIKDAAGRQKIRDSLKMVESYVTAMIAAALQPGEAAKRQLLLERERLIDDVVKMMKDDL